MRSLPHLAIHVLFTCDAHVLAVLILSDLPSGIRNGNFSVVLVSPESIVQVQTWRELIVDNPIYDDQTCLLAVDEAHVIPTW